MDMHSGKDGTVLVGSDELNITAWTINPSTEVLRYRTSKTDGATVKRPQFGDYAGTITVEHDFDDSPFEGTVNIRVGEFLSNVKFYLRKSDGTPFTTEPYWDLPSILVTGTPQSLEIEGKIQTTFNFEGDGAFGYPGNAVGS